MVRPYHPPGGNSSASAPASPRSTSPSVYAYSCSSRLFEQLSVFAGTFSLEGAEEVCSVESPSIFDGLARLIDQSLVLATADEAGERRYRLLEILRAYGQARLQQSGELAQMRNRLTAWALAQSEQAGASLRGPNQAEWLRWAEREHDHIRSALDWSISAGNADTVLRIAGALWWSWLLHGRWTEAHDWLQRALNMPVAAPRTVARARALHGACTTAALRGQYGLRQGRRASMSALQSRASSTTNC